jgi:hypothetical protein
MGEDVVGDVVSIFAMSEWWVGDDRAVCVLSKTFFVGLDQRELLSVFLGQRKATYCIVLYCIAWVVKEMEKLDGF